MVEINASLISIIIPVYKVEPFLRQCLDSVIGQSYANLEIILVDDGSPDRCPEICDKYAQKDNRINVIHKENGGLSSARNSGLDACKGDYITFVDSDDWISEQYIETLFLLIIEEDADIVIGENKLFYNNCLDIDKNKRIITNNYTQQEALNALFRKNLVSHTVSWGKLYKKSLFKNLRFPIDRYHEDEFTTYILFFNSTKITYTNKILYYYRQRLGSITGTEHNQDFICAKEQQLAFFKEKQFDKLLPFILAELCWLLLRSFNDAICHGQSKIAKTALADLQKHAKEPEFKNIRFTHRVFLSIFSTVPQLYLFFQSSKKFFSFSKSR